VIKRFAILLGAFIAVSAQAKCTNVPYTVIGTVVTIEDSSPVSDALVVLMWNDTVKGTLLERTARTDAAGRYSIEVPFYPWRGNVRGTDQCDATLGEVTMFVAAPGFDSQQVSQLITGTATTANYSLKRTAAE
jgi:hypothetical protein